jgi:hypothetical protein
MGSNIDYQISVIDHHITGYKYHASDDNEYMLKSKTCSLYKYSEILLQLLYSGIQNKEELYYCYHKDYSACKMIYYICINVLSRLDVDISDSVFSNQQI